MKTADQIFDELLIKSLRDSLDIRTAERDELKVQLFEARQALLEEGMRANALQAKIDGGIRVYAFSVGGIEALELFSALEKLNATLILDEGVEL